MNGFPSASYCVGVFHGFLSLSTMTQFRESQSLNNFFILSCTLPTPWLSPCFCPVILFPPPPPRHAAQRTLNLSLEEEAHKKLDGEKNEIIELSESDPVDPREALINDAVRSDTRLLPGGSETLCRPLLRLSSNLCVRVRNFVFPFGTTGTLPSYPCLCLSPMKSPCSPPSQGCRAGLSLAVSLLHRSASSLGFLILLLRYPSGAAVTSSSGAN